MPIIDIPLIYKADSVLPGKRKPTEHYVLEFIPFELPVSDHEKYPVAASFEDKAEYLVKNDKYYTNYRGLPDDAPNMVKVDEMNALLDNKNLIKELTRTTMRVVYNKESVFLSLKKDGNTVLFENYQASKTKISNEREMMLDKLTKRMDGAFIKNGKVFIQTNGPEFLLLQNMETSIMMLPVDMDTRTYCASKDIRIGLNAALHIKEINEDIKNSMGNNEITIRSIPKCITIHPESVLKDEAHSLPDANILLDDIFGPLESENPMNGHAQYMKYMSPKTLLLLSEIKSLYKEIDSSSDVEMLVNRVEEYMGSLQDDYPKQINMNHIKLHCELLKSVIARTINAPACDANNVTPHI